jgi:hypothetical protein
MKLPAEMMKLAQHIIRTKSAELHPSIKDHYLNALVRNLRKKHAKRPTGYAAPVGPSRESVVNLMTALRRSIAADRGTKRRPGTAGANLPGRSVPRRGSQGGLKRCPGGTVTGRKQAPTRARAESGFPLTGASRFLCHPPGSEKLAFGDR